MAGQLVCSRYMRINKPTASSRFLLFIVIVSSFVAISLASESGSAASNAETHFPTSHVPAETPLLDGLHQFTLRHIFHHGTYQHPYLHRRKDISNPGGDLWSLSEDGTKHKLSSLQVKSRSTKIQRLKERTTSNVVPVVADARGNSGGWNLSPSVWTVENVPGPNITDKGTVLNLAKISANAYTEIPDAGDWLEVGQGYNSSLDFGWEGEGLRGHIFADETNSTIIIGLKGTSMSVFAMGGTSTNDKENDNLFFSCCCAQQGQYIWRQVCDCATSTYTCNDTCVVGALRGENRYYQAALHLYSNITAIYPKANVWVVGHSLGGAVSSLLGMTYGLPTVTFEAPGDVLAATRLGLPIPPGYSTHQSRDNMGIYHFGHTADPIYLGTCNGATGSCSYAGYAMETQCHTGYECVYDVVADKGWGVSIRTHRIRSVIDDVIEKYDTVPVCVTTPECMDCALWKYFDGNSSSSTTTSTSGSTSKTQTRTESCTIPGWWGCLDETTTTEDISTTTSTTTTSTCETPGWFGCNDKTTTTSTADTITSHTSIEATTSSQSPGFFSCKDSIGTISSAKIHAPQQYLVPNDANSVSTFAKITTSVPTVTQAPDISRTKQVVLGIH